MHKIIFNIRLLLSIKAVNTILMDIIGGRSSQAATHLALDKKLISDIANVEKLSIITIYAYVTKYYDRVTHPFASLCTIF